MTFWIQVFFELHKSSPPLLSRFDHQNTPSVLPTGILLCLPGGSWRILDYQHSLTPLPIGIVPVTTAGSSGTHSHYKQHCRVYASCLVYQRHFQAWCRYSYEYRYLPVIRVGIGSWLPWRTKVWNSHLESAYHFTGYQKSMSLPDPTFFFRIFLGLLQNGKQNICFKAMTCPKV